MDGGERFSQFLRPSGSQSAAVQNKGELAVAVHLQHPPTVAPTALNWCHVVIALGAGGGDPAAIQAGEILRISINNPTGMLQCCNHYIRTAPSSFPHGRLGGEKGGGIITKGAKREHTLCF